MPGRAQREPGISRFPDAQLRICGLVLAHHPGMTVDHTRAFASNGTAASYLEFCSTSEVLTLRTCGAAVRCVTKSWNVAMSGATHFRMKSTSPDSIQHSRTSGSARTNSSNARKSASAWLDRCTEEIGR